MRIFPLALIAVGVIALLRHYGLIEPEWLQLFWPLLIIGIGVAMLARGPRWRADMRDRMQDRWERRMHRHFGPGWANLSDEERERFRAGMRQWRSSFHGGWGGHGSSASTPAGDDSPPKSPGQPPAPGEQR
jgi:Domain of unknown function (DUF5668)